MKHTSILFLKAAILLLAVLVFVGLLWFPQTEGRAVNLDIISIYSDPLIIYVYIGSISFFVGLYQIFKILTLIDSKRSISRNFIKPLQILKFASLSLIGFIALALMYIHYFANGDDPAGPTGLGIMVSFVAAIIASIASYFQKKLS